MAPSRPPHRRGTRSPEGPVGGRPRRTPAYPLIALVIVLVVLGTGAAKDRYQGKHRQTLGWRAWSAQRNADGPSTQSSCKHSSN
jgi:hypothetical protein